MTAPAMFEDVFFPSADGRLTFYARNYPGGNPLLHMMHVVASAAAARKDSSVEPPGG